jgi:hypothetical protein
VRVGGQEDGRVLSLCCWIMSGRQSNPRQNVIRQYVTSYGKGDSARSAKVR